VVFDFLKSHLPAQARLLHFLFFWKNVNFSLPPPPSWAARVRLGVYLIFGSGCPFRIRFIYIFFRFPLCEDDLLFCFAATVKFLRSWVGLLLTAVFKSLSGGCFDGKNGTNDAFAVQSRVADLCPIGRFYSLRYRIFCS
jgi:hypothetical protein